MFIIIAGNETSDSFKYQSFDDMISGLKVLITQYSKYCMTLVLNKQENDSKNQKLVGAIKQYIKLTPPNPDPVGFLIIRDSDLLILNMLN